MLGDLKFCSMFVLLCSSVCVSVMLGAGVCRCSGLLRYRRAKKKKENETESGSVVKSQMN